MAISSKNKNDVNNKLLLYNYTYKPDYTSFIKNDNSATKNVYIKRPDFVDIAQRQMHAESRFKQNAKSRAGAYGPYQIMQSTLNDYNKANNTKLKLEDLSDYGNSIKVRNWYFDSLWNRPWAYAGNASDEVRMAKALAAYNMGPTNLVRQLNALKNNGFDIYSTTAFLDSLPKEPTDYVNYIQYNKPTGISRNNLAFTLDTINKSDLMNQIRNGVMQSEHYKKKSNGGHLHRTLYSMGQLSDY